MWLIPYERFSIVTDLSIAEVIDRLEESFEDQRNKGAYLKPSEAINLVNKGFINKRYKKTKEPVITTNPPSITYNFIPLVKGRNSFIPIIKCFARENDHINNTVVFFRFRTHPILLIFFLPFLLMTLGICNKPGYNIMHDPTAYIVIIALYLFFLMMFKYESQKAKKDLKSLLSASE